MLHFRPTRMEVNLNNLATNFKAIDERIGDGIRTIAVIKADGYGMGMVPTARTLAAAGCRFFAVAVVDEALKLRDKGIRGDILVLGPCNMEAVPELIRADVTVAFTDPAIIPMAEAASRIMGRPLKCHLKIDTGMGRIGFMPDEVGPLLDRLGDDHAGLAITGLFSHFATADGATTDFMEDQWHRFKAVDRLLSHRGVGPLIRHISNSAAILRAPEMRLDACRAGIILYGMYPSADTPRTIDLKPVFEVKTVVGLVRHLPAGYGISYGQKFHTTRDSRIAVLPLGYADGIAREFSGRLSVLIGGCRYPQVGNICMDQMMVDVTDGTDVKQGDEVVIIGRQGQARITPEELAALRPNTINYEIPIMFGSRVPREYV